jgi:hypothetical protein
MFLCSFHPLIFWSVHVEYKNTTYNEHWRIVKEICFLSDNDNDNDKPIKSLLKGKGLLPLVGLARLDS